MNRRTTVYGIALALALTTIVALAPGSAAEHCWEVGVDEEKATATWGPCSGLTVEVDPGSQDSDDGAASVDAALSDGVALQADGVCWYVIVQPHQIGPAEAAVWQCDPDVTVDEDWDPQEDPIYSDAYGEEVYLDDLTPATTQEHCWNLGAEVGPAVVIYNPCGSEIGVDKENPDNVVAYRGYSEHEVVDGPL